jgi:hypothetical protein
MSIGSSRILSGAQSRQISNATIYSPLPSPPHHHTGSNNRGGVLTLQSLKTTLRHGKNTPTRRSKFKTRDFKSSWDNKNFLLTPWSRVTPEKLTGLHLVKKFTDFNGTRMFITAFTTAPHFPYPESDDSNP